MSGSRGLDGLEQAVRPCLDYAESKREFFLARRDETPWWQWDLKHARTEMANWYAGQALAYGVVLELIERDTKAEVREEERAYYHQEAERQEAQLAEDHERQMEAEDREAGEGAEVES